MDKKTAGKPEPHGKRINAKRLAEDLDVSISTISRAFNKEAVIAPETRSKILNYADQLGYRPNPFAQSLITQKSRIVGIIVSHLENPFYPEALRGLSEALREAGWHLMLFTVPSGETPDDILPLAISYQPEFVIVMAVTISSQSQEVAERAGTKLIYFNRRDPDSSTFYVVCDNAHGGGMIADHFIDTGCRRLAYIAGFQNASTTLDRWRGFRDRCIARGFPDVWREEGYSFSYEAGYHAAIRLMNRSPRPDAVFCASDIIALGCIEAVRIEFGLRVPEDVSVAGLDNIEMAAWPSHSLTTYSQPLAKMIGATVKLIEEISIGAESETVAWQIKGDIIVRKSTRPPTGGKRSGALPDMPA
ncbi:MAG: LacI family DNA-binding transcriptional regulator [Rhodospirillaceae bacterium]|nr:LacI family DNA-binding transcriptional regulator [Rhodospirillaceae bacterium]